MATRLIVERDVEAVMRDGTILRANVYRPDVAERLPVLLQRTPYGKDISDVGFCLLSAERGYAVVVQDTRGRWASDGDHYPMRGEFEDGYDTVEWAAAQHWASGKVGMWGGSYVGYTQWTAAVSQPPSLVAIFPWITFTDLYADLWHPGGALALGVLVSWGLGAGVSMAIERMNVSTEEKAALREALVDTMDSLGQGSTFATLPLSSMPLLSREDMGQVGEAYLAMTAHVEDDAYWNTTNARRRLDQVSVPAYHLGGWYDIFVGGTLANYVDMRRSAATEDARASQKLIMGPWSHGPLRGLVGEVDFGFRASEAYVLPNELMWRWFDYWLKGIDNGIMDEPPVRIFVMGLNRWRDEKEWPLARTVYTPYYLHSAGRANTLAGDGTLSTEVPVDESPDGYTYDPAEPVPTRGGGLCCWQAALPPGALDQRSIEERDDVLVYTTEGLEQDLEVTGPVEMVLWATSDAVDTDFTAKLVDVHPCGYARNILDGIVRARYRHTTKELRLLVPGVVERYTIDLGATSNVFLKGHRVRIEISSSNFPRFDRNPNTGHGVEHESQMRVALQTVCHDAGHPSHVLLPVIPR